MFGAILTATKSSFQKGMTFCRSTYVKKVMKLLAFIFEQPLYMLIEYACGHLCFTNNYYCLMLLLKSYIWN